MGNIERDTGEREEVGGMCQELTLKTCETRDTYDIFK